MAAPAESELRDALRNEVEIAYAEVLRVLDEVRPRSRTLPGRRVDQMVSIDRQVARRAERLAALSSRWEGLLGRSPGDRESEALARINRVLGAVQPQNGETVAMRRARGASAGSGPDSFVNWFNALERELEDLWWSVAAALDTSGPDCTASSAPDVCSSPERTGSECTGRATDRIDNGDGVLPPDLTEEDIEMINAARRLRSMGKRETNDAIADELKRVSASSTMRRRAAALRRRNLIR